MPNTRLVRPTHTTRVDRFFDAIPQLTLSDYPQRQADIGDELADRLGIVGDDDRYWDSDDGDAA